MDLNTLIKLDVRLKTPRSNLGVLYSESKLYVMGGFTGKEVVNNFELFDKNSKSWAELPRMPYKKRDFCAVMGLNKNIFVIGGSDEREYIVFNNKKSKQDSRNV